MRDLGRNAFYRYLCRSCDLFSSAKPWVDAFRSLFTSFACFFSSARPWGWNVFFNRYLRRSRDIGVVRELGRKEFWSPSKSFACFSSIARPSAKGVLIAICVVRAMLNRARPWAKGIFRHLHCSFDFWVVRDLGRTFISSQVMFFAWIWSSARPWARDVDRYPSRLRDFGVVRDLGGKGLWSLFASITHFLSRAIPWAKGVLIANNVVYVSYE